MEFEVPLPLSTNTFNKYCIITMLKCQTVYQFLHYYIRKMYLSLQHSNIPMKNGFVFVIYSVGVKLLTHINICVMSFVHFVICMYAVQKRETIKQKQKDNNTFNNTLCITKHTDNL